MAASLTDILTTLQNGVTAINGLTVANSYTFFNGNVRTVYVSSTGTPVLPAATARKFIIFHNPNDTAPLMVSPATDVNGAILSPTFASSLRGGGFLILPQDYLAFSGNVQGAWNAVANSTGSPITISEI